MRRKIAKRRKPRNAKIKRRQWVAPDAPRRKRDADVSPKLQTQPPLIPDSGADAANVIIRTSLPGRNTVTLNITEPIPPPEVRVALEPATATGVAAPLGVEISKPLAGVATIGGVGDPRASAGTRTSMASVLTLTPDSYVVPAALRAALDEARANVLPRLIEIETSLNRLAPVLEQLEKSDAWRHTIGGNNPPESIEAQPLTVADIRITLIADKTMRAQLSPDRPSIDREALALAWQACKFASKKISALAGLVTAALCMQLGKDLLMAPAQFHQVLHNLQANLESVVSGLEYFLRAVGAF